ncbi:hypothetical protein ACLB2K_029318 [Fragaria x ananassa]
MDRARGRSSSPFLSSLFFSFSSLFLPQALPERSLRQTSCHQPPPSSQRRAAALTQNGPPPPPLSPRSVVRAGSVAGEENTPPKRQIVFRLSSLLRPL